MLLLKLAEECNEVAHRVHKAIKFGLNEKQSEDHKNNRERIEDELADLLTVMAVLIDEGIINHKPWSDAVEADIKRRKERIEKYFKYSQELGILEK